MAYFGKNGSVYYNVMYNDKYFSYFNKNKFTNNKPVRLYFNEEKKSQIDFVLWKKVKSNEIGWYSPWGNGRPGWHIECSSISIYYFGDKCDIHGGGADLKFPHHHNELAQSESLLHKKYINIWMHVGSLIYNKIKMSKSYNNVIMLNKFLININSEILRAFILFSHYRSEIILCKKDLFFSKSLILKMYNISRELYCSKKIIITNHKKLFITAMNNDFNTSLALSILFDLTNKIIFLKNKCKSSASKLFTLLNTLSNSVGLSLYTAKFFFSNNFLKGDKINFLIKKRNISRYKNNWGVSDVIRIILLKYKIRLTDIYKKTHWSYICN